MGIVKRKGVPKVTHGYTSNDHNFLNIMRYIVINLSNEKSSSLYSNIQTVDHLDFYTQIYDQFTEHHPVCAPNCAVVHARAHLGESVALAARSSPRCVAVYQGRF